MFRTALRLTLAALPLAAAPAGAQSFQLNTTDVPSGSPGNNSYSENVDFGDVDLDGDFDAVFADGGNQGNDQNRIWINQGGLQGAGLGTFVDETGTRLPTISDTSRDVELADLDGDADLDLGISNTSSLVNQPSRFWINLGGHQGGSAGFYADETGSRWIGLGGAGSSVPPFSILPTGGFIDWSGDTDFADIDNDGDLDLYHSSYGGAFGGNVPSRVFLNSGTGYFRELNPGGLDLSTTPFMDGLPAAWAEGVQMHGTTDTTGAEADIADSPLDVELADLDGDFDLDVLQGSRDTVPRIFHNRMVETGGALVFRDVSHAVLPPSRAVGGGNYEQELGDLDRDGDLDLIGLNWAMGSTFSFHDATFENLGNGVFGPPVVLSSSGADDNEVDVIDYDNDGDLDLYVSNFSGADKLYRNNENGSGTYSFTNVGTAELPMGTQNITNDADVCDVDLDGDYDVFTASDNGKPNVYLENITQVPDTTAPRIPALEVHGDQVAHADPLSVRAHVYDNQPLYAVWYESAFLLAALDGIQLFPGGQPMGSSGGQVFRGELPGHLVGTVSYLVYAQDRYLNSNVSSPVIFTSTGDSGTPYGGSTGTAEVRALSEARAGRELFLAGYLSGLDSGVPSFLGISAASASLPLAGGLLLNIDALTANLLHLAAGTTDSNGHFVHTTPELPASLAGHELFVQYVAFSGGAVGFECSRGLRLTVQ